MASPSVPLSVFFTGVACIVLGHLELDLPAVLAERDGVAADDAAVAARVELARVTYTLLSTSTLHLGTLAVLLLVGVVGVVRALRRRTPADLAAVALFVGAFAVLPLVVLPNEEILMKPETPLAAQRAHLATAGYGHMVIVAATVLGQILQFIPHAASASSAAPKPKRA